LCLKGNTDQLHTISDEKTHRAWTPWRTLTFREVATGKTFKTEYTVACEEPSGVWRPFGYPAKMVNCVEIT
jgi:hypothetical protein